MESRVLVLNDNAKYLVVKELEKDNHVYYQVIKIDGEEDFVLVEKIGQDLFLITDETLIGLILSEMYK